MPIIPLLGHDAADSSLLLTANSNGRMALPLGVPMDPMSQKVFDRAIDNGWIQFIDIAPMPGHAPGSVVTVRVYRVTAEGAARLKEIQGRRKIDGTH